MGPLQERKRRGLGAVLAGKWPFFLALALGLALDLWTKEAAFRLEHPITSEGQVTWVAGRWLGLTHTLNPGAVWGLGRGFPGFLLVLRLAVLGFVLAFALAMGPARRMILAALGLVSAGAVGNLHDNLTVRPEGFTWDFGALLRAPGRVRDFLHVDLGFWPADPWPDFNVADSLILIGVGLLALLLPGPKRTSKTESAAAPDSR